MSSSPEPLRRRLGFAAVASIVVGDMLGSGVFFTPGELASVAREHWQVYFFWALAGIIVLCGALSLAELSSLLPQAGAGFHIIREGFGPFWAFLKIWVEMLVSGPGSVAGVAIVFGTYMTEMVRAPLTPVGWGIVAIAIFTAINLCGVEWGGRTQIVVTVAKAGALLALVIGALLVGAPAGASAAQGTWSAPPAGSSPVGSFIQMVGLGVAAVLFTYDGWIDVTHVAGEVVDPKKNLSRGLYLGVGFVTVLYLIVNYAYLQIVPLPAMREAPTLVAARAAERAFGPAGGRFITFLIVVSIFGALGGLVMTLPRLYYAAAARYRDLAGASHPLHLVFQRLAAVAPRTVVPAGSILYCAVASSVALAAFGSFGRIVNFFVVPVQAINALMIAAIFRLRQRSMASGQAFRAPAYPVTPLIFIVVMLLFLTSALYYRPGDTLVGVALALTGLPVYFWIGRDKLA